jgi:hypothetical protein
VANVDEGECVILRTTALVLGESGEGADPAFAGLRINDIKIQKENNLNLIDLKLCTWLLIAVDDGTPPTGDPRPPSFALPSTYDAMKKFMAFHIKLDPSQLNGKYKIFILATDSSGNPINILNHRFEDSWNGKPAETQLESDGQR